MPSTLLSLSFSFFATAVFLVEPSWSQDGPSEPLSDLVEHEDGDPVGVTFLWETLTRKGKRGDNWCMTWAADDNIYTTMDDGIGWNEDGVKWGFRGDASRTCQFKLSPKWIYDDGRTMWLIWSDAGGRWDGSNYGHSNYWYRWNQVKIALDVHGD